jgi:hypothetical protein
MRNAVEAALAYMRAGIAPALANWRAAQEHGVSSAEVARHTGAIAAGMRHGLPRSALGGSYWLSGSQLPHDLGPFPTREDAAQWARVTELRGQFFIFEVVR